MDAPQNLGSGLVPSIKASIKLLALAGLLLCLTPVHMVLNLFKTSHPFRMVLLFHRMALRIFGFDVRWRGSVSSASPTFFVANHASYLDIPVLASILPAAFIAKAEVEKWPVFGFLAKCQQTLFVERKARHTKTQVGKIQERLSKGQSLIMFPEGTSSDGFGILPFKSALFSALEEAKDTPHLKVQPISITCTGLDHLPMTRTLRPYYSWFGDMTLARHFWDVLKFGHFTVDLVLHTPISPASFPDRKALAHYCEREVAMGVEKCLGGRFLPDKIEKDVNQQEPKLLTSAIKGQSA